jgi:hypothetical protein
VTIVADGPEWRQTSVSVNDHVVLTLGELVDGWSAHVHRLVVEQGASAGDQSVWIAHDYVAAMQLRDAIARGVDKLAPALRSDADAGVEAADRLFMDSTSPDEGGVVRAFAEIDTSHTGWWWSRLPRTGPIRAELDEWHALS